MWADCFMLGQALENQPQLRQIAEEWLNYILTDAYQAHILRGAGYEPVTTTVMNVLTAEEQARLHLNDPAYNVTNRYLWPTLEKKDRKGLERLWHEALAKRK